MRALLGGAFRFMATQSGNSRQGQMGKPMSREAEEIAIGPLLARANLLRVRGQWNEAIAACTDALRKAPTSAATHSLLAQIYEAQNRPDEAISWYSLALELDPNNATDRARWERLTQAQRARLRVPVRPESPASKKTLVIVKEKTIERTLNWLDRIFPPGQSRTIARMIYAVCAVIATLLVVSAIAVYFVILPQNKGSLLPPPVINGPPVVVPPPAIETPPKPTTEEPGSPGAAVQNSSTRPSNASGRPLASNSSTPNAAPRPTSTPGPTTEDIALRDELSRAAGGNYQVLTAQRFPATVNSESSEIVRPTPTGLMNLALDVVVATTQDWETTREQVVRTAVQAAYLAFDMDTRLDRVMVRVALSGLNAHPVPIFYGELARVAIQGADPGRAGLADLLSRFSALQWYALPTNAIIRDSSTPMPNPTPNNIFIPR